MATETKHTPGPWHRGWVYAALRHINRNVDDSTFFDWDAVEDADSVNTPNVRINRADADLIAAAPDLLAALEEAITLVEFFHGVPGWTEYQSSPEMKRLRAAIAKARGEERDHES